MSDIVACRACEVEAELGTENVPHPVDARAHTCATAQDPDAPDPLTVAELHRESYQTACDKGWHDEDDLSPNYAVVGLADEMLTVMGIARRMEDIRKGIEPTALENELPEVRLTDLSNKQVRVLAWLALICSEAAEAAEDVIANRWETTLNEKGKPEGFKTEVADIEIRIGDMLGALRFDLEHDLRTKLLFNKTRDYRHGRKKA